MSNPTLSKEPCLLLDRVDRAEAEAMRPVPGYSSPTLRPVDLVQRDLRETVESIDTFWHEYRQQMRQRNAAVADLEVGRIVALTTTRILHAIHDLGEVKA